ncbi:hypothetical protein Clacol_007560 [Clathrus columnatus]|uniref:Transcriptional repressor Tup1 N-terminal domain-containing protein n=1 Tax=Clathrus columnatus TaxID=1419009 RepID=A0AAV5AIG9_9AGAM|nr:hypothetical protein Clacol_007560 [Clathrus columnatus]
MPPDFLQFSSYRAQSDDFYRRPNNYPTRRLSAAIDSLRREGETILWELNSLTTQNSTLEQRLLGQTEELNRLNASLISLRDQHRAMEQQYKEKLQALRLELTAAQGGIQPSVTGHSNNRLPSRSNHERHHSPSPPRSPDYSDRRQSRQHSRPSTPSIIHSFRHRDSSSRISSYSYSVDHKENEVTPRDSGSSPIPHSRQQHSFNTPSLRPVSSFEPPTSFPGARRLMSPQGNPSSHDVSSPPGTGHEPSVSPTATLIGSDGPGRSRQRKTRG